MSDINLHQNFAHMGVNPIQATMTFTPTPKLNLKYHRRGTFNRGFHETPDLAQSNFALRDSPCTATHAE